jgi:hypothetical protein
LTTPATTTIATTISSFTLANRLSNICNAAESAPRGSSPSVTILHKKEYFFRRRRRQQQQQQQQQQGYEESLLTKKVRGSSYSILEEADIAAMNRLAAAQETVASAMKAQAEESKKKC